MLPILLKRSFVAIGLTCALSLPAAGQASKAKAEVAEELLRLEAKIEGTRWNLNTLHEKKKLQGQLTLISRLYDRIVQYEGDMMAFPCAGATLPSWGSRSPAGSSEGVPVPAGPPRVPAGVTGPVGGGPVYGRGITDAEVRLLAQIVYLEHRIGTGPWHFNNLHKRKAIEKEIAKLKGELRTIRNSHC